MNLVFDVVAKEIMAANLRLIQRFQKESLDFKN